MIYIEGTGICGPSLPPNVLTVPDLPACAPSEAPTTEDATPMSSKDDDEKKNSTSQSDDGAPDVGLSTAGIVAIAVVVPLSCLCLLIGAGVYQYHRRKKKAAAAGGPMDMHQVAVVAH